MFLNETYEYPSELPDSLAEDSHAIEENENPSIKAVNLYELERSVSDEASDEGEGSRATGHHLEIIHSLDESSI